MKRKRTKHLAPRVGKKIQPSSEWSREVTVNEVVENLFALFEHLGFDISHRVPYLDNDRASENSRHPLYPYASAITELLTSWHQDPIYLDNLGNPAPLRRRGRRPSFRSLAQRWIPGIDETYLLSELERLGAVTVNEKDFIGVHMRSLPAYEDRRFATQHTLASLDGFISTLRHNLDSAPSNSDQLFHRIAWNSDFDCRELPALKIRMRRHGQTFLESFDNWLARKSLSKTRKQYRHARQTKVSIGVYLSVDPVDRNQ
jgi:hypothetical protein